MFARTERLTLRPAWPEDDEALTATGYEPLVRLLARDAAPSDGADVEGTASPTPHDPRFVIEAHEAGRPTLIGAIRLSHHATDADLAFWLAPPARGRGYATEAGRAVIDMARHALPLVRLRARHCVKDAASARVLSKLGFQPTGHQTAAGASAADCTVEQLYDLDVAFSTTSRSLSLAA